MLEYSPTSAFWLFNRVTNFAYMRYDMIAADIRKVTDAWENGLLEEVRGVDARPGSSRRRPHAGATSRASASGKAQELFARWSKLDRYLMVKYMDGNVKSEHGDVLAFLDSDAPMAKHFVENGNGRQIPDKIRFPGYNEVEARRGGRQRQDTESGKIISVL